MNQDKKKRFILFIFVTLLGVILILLYINTGIFNRNSIDKRDLDYWNYTDGLIKNTDSFNINGNNKTCWILIHSYCATPREMKELSEEIHKEFNDSVYTLKLWGHGEIPSRILNLTFDDWYKQTEEEFNKISSECKNINLAGSSLGASLALKLAEEKQIKNLYLLNTYLKIDYKWYYIFAPESYLKIFADLFIYIKKTKTAEINSEKGLREHIAYWNFPLQPIKNSFNFLEIIKENADNVNEPVLILHSRGDNVANSRTVTEIYEKFTNKNKEIILFEKSNHILLMDYDKDDVIKGVIEFEKKNR